MYNYNLIIGNSLFKKNFYVGKLISKEEIESTFNVSFK